MVGTSRGGADTGARVGVDVDGREGVLASGGGGAATEGVDVGVLGGTDVVVGRGRGVGVGVGRTVGDGVGVGVGVGVGGGGGGTGRLRQPAASLRANGFHEASSVDDPLKPIRNSRLRRPCPVWTAYSSDDPTTTELYESCQGAPGTAATTRTAPLTGSRLTTFAVCPKVEIPYSTPVEGSAAKSSTDSANATGASRTTRSTLLYDGLRGSMSIV